jgi:hypothetical protein
MRNVAANASTTVHTIEGNTIVTHRSQQSQPDFANMSMPISNGTSLTSQSNVSLSLSNISVGYSNASFGGAGGVAPLGTTEDTTKRIAIGENGLSLESGLSREKRQRFSSGRQGDTGALPSPVRSSTTATVNHQHTSSAAAAVDPLSPVDTHYADQSVHKIHKPGYQDASVGSDSGGSFNGTGITPTFSHLPFAQPTASHAHSRSSNFANTLSLGSSSSGISTGFRSSRTPQAQSVILIGPAGIGKSSLIQMHQAYWRRHGLWGHAKMVKGQASPFTGLVSFLASSCFRVLTIEPLAHVLVICPPSTHDVPE